MINVISNLIVINGFADDCSICKDINPSLVDHEVQTIAKLEGTSSNISIWMDAMHLKCNGNKTEYILFGSLKQCKNPNSQQQSHRDELRFINHITAKCRAATAKLVKIQQIRKYLTKSACETVVMGLFISHLDYANFILYGLPHCSIHSLQ